jgi:hypothetical protein
MFAVAHHRADPGIVRGGRLQLGDLAAGAGNGELVDALGVIEPHPVLVTFGVENAQRILGPVVLGRVLVERHHLARRHPADHRLALTGQRVVARQHRGERVPVGQHRPVQRDLPAIHTVGQPGLPRRGADGLGGVGIRVVVVRGDRVSSRRER